MMDELLLELEEIERQLQNAEAKSLEYYKAFFHREILKSKIQKLEVEGV